MLNQLEKKIITFVQGDIPITERPYQEFSKKLNISEQLFIKILKDLDSRGTMRRFGATLRHQKSGYTSNAMIAWKVKNTEVDKIGAIMASFDEVSHCYHRNPVEAWPYSLYTMIHGKNKKECFKTIEKISNKTMVKKYAVLFSNKELKKTSMTYFKDLS